MLRAIDSPVILTPKLTVVGAGPGDPDFITLKGVAALREAAVVLYDALVHPDLLLHAPAPAQHIYVGKRRDKKMFAQEEIHELIVHYAKLYGPVVRLKGGDPFVFGRGWEEMHYAAAQGIAVQYIPGISAAVAGPGAVGIAVTLRGASRGFWTLTATTADGTLNPDIFHAALVAQATVVILMGRHKIGEIVAVFIAAGAAEAAIGIIWDATLPTQYAVFGTMIDILEKIKTTQHQGAATIVIGDSVRHRV